MPSCRTQRNGMEKRKEKNTRKEAGLGSSIAFFPQAKRRGDAAMVGAYVGADSAVNDLDARSYQDVINWQA